MIRRNAARRHTEASRHVDAVDPRKLPEVRAFAANERDIRRVDLLETQHDALGHRRTSGMVPRCTAPVARSLSADPSTGSALPVDRSTDDNTRIQQLLDS